MKELLMDALRHVHVIAGFLGLAAFWVPILTRKGGKTHRLYGKVFKYSAYVVLYAALVSVLAHMADALAAGTGPRQAPGGFAFLVFLGYLALVTLIGLRHGLAVLQNKDMVSLDTSLNRSLAWLAVVSSMALISYTLYYRPPNAVVLYALSPIGFATGLGILKAIGGRRAEGKAWFYEHMGSMMGTGIAFHTAFAVFGFSRIFDLGLTGVAAVIPWILPALIGIPAITLWTRHYRRRFGDLPA